MDFKTAQPIIDALTARAQEGIWGYTSPDSYFEAIRAGRSAATAGTSTRLMSWSLGWCQPSVLVNSLPRGDKVLIQTPVYSSSTT